MACEMVLALLWWRLEQLMSRFSVYLHKGEAVCDHGTVTLNVCVVTIEVIISNYEDSLSMSCHIAACRKTTVSECLIPLSNVGYF